MNERQTKMIISIAFFTGGILGMAGTFAPSSFRGLAWGLDGVSLIAAGVLLAVYYFRKGYDTLAVGFLIFSIGESLILSCSAINLDKNISSFGAGTGLWSVSLLLISFQKVFPLIVRCTGFIAAALFGVVSLLIFTGYPLNPLTQPLPFYAYPFIAATIFGWSWTLLKRTICQPEEQGRIHLNKNLY